MFGYIVADLNNLSDDDKKRYNACYCGLCRAIGQKYGTIQRLSLNYDVTFLILLLGSLYEPQEHHGRKCCLAHSAGKRAYYHTDITDYGAAVNLTLVYYKCIDDWTDDRRVDRLAESVFFKSAADRFQTDFPRQHRAVVTCLQSLAAMESDDLRDPDRGANLFGEMLGELFVLREDDRWADLLRTFGQSLGRFIYLLDAICDLKTDLKKKRYNPLKSLHEGGWTVSDAESILAMILGECTAAFEKLPLVQDIDLLRNILYSGLWLHYFKAKEDTNIV